MKHFVGKLLTAGLLMLQIPVAAAERELRVGVYQNEPKIYLDAAGQPAGIFVELLNEIAAREGWRLDYRRCAWEDCLAALRRGELDLLPDVAFSPRRAETLNFHDQAALHSWSQVYAPAGAELVSVFQLSGRRVAVLRGSVQEADFAELMAGFGIEIELLPVASLEEAFALARRREADAAIANHRYGMLHAPRFELVQTPIVFQPVALYFAAPLGRDREVLAAIDRWLGDWRRDEASPYYQILRRWEAPAPIRVPKALWWSLAAAIALLLAALAAASWLRREVRTKTAHLAESERRLATILDSVGAQVYIKDSQLRYVYANQQLLALYRRPAAEILGHRDAELRPGSAGAEANDRRVLEHGERLTAEETVDEPGGRRTFLAVKIPLRDAEGQIYGLCAIATDITQRKRDEAATRLAATVFESQESMIVTDAEGAILSTNRAFTRLTGYSAEEVRGGSPRFLLSQRQDPELYGALWHQLREQGGWQGEVLNRKRGGEDYPAWLTATAVRGGDGQVSHFVFTMSDVSEHRKAEQAIRRLAYYDTLTALPNRSFMLDRLRRALAVERPRSSWALIYVDLDQFKDLNDSLGHEAGDLLLREAARRLNSVVQRPESVARLGGDEFAVLLEDLPADPAPAAAQAERLARRLLAVLSQPYRLGDHSHHCTNSIGVAVAAAADGLGADDLLKRAEMAMYRAKQAGRNTVWLFSPELQEAVASRIALEADLRQGLRRGEFRLVYQPQVDQAGAVVGAEALLRWRHPLRGEVPPGEFIPLAESCGLILPLGRWVLAAALRQLAEWAATPATAGLRLAVNVSARQFRSPEFVDQLIAELDGSGAPADRLKLELTETVLVDDLEETAARMRSLSRLGVRFSLDDFGTGYSSLAYLKRLPLDQLKIDQSFVRDVLVDPVAATIARTIVGLGDSLELDVIAEGVETPAQRDFLAGIGCRAYQGYLFGRPDSVEALERLCSQSPGGTASLHQGG